MTERVEIEVGERTVREKFYVDRMVDDVKQLYDQEAEAAAAEPDEQTEDRPQQKLTTEGFVASFLGNPRMNLIRSRTANGQLNVLTAQVASPRLLNQISVWCGFRPEAVRQDAGLPIQISGTVSSVPSAAA